MAIGIVAALALVAGPAADAQAPADEEGAVKVEAGHPLGSSVHYVIEVTHADGAPAGDATVTATVVGTDGNERGTVTLTPFGASAADGVEVDDAVAQQGRYEGVVEFSEAGRWTVRFEADGPAGTAETTVEVQEPGASGLSAPDDNAGGGFAPADDAGDTSSSSGDGGLPVLVIAVAALVAISGLAAALRIVRRYGLSASPATSSKTPSADTTTPAEQVPAADDVNVGASAHDER